MYFRNSRQALAHHRNLDKYREEVPKEVLDDLSEYSIRREEELESESWRECESSGIPWILDRVKRREFPSFHAWHKYTHKRKYSKGSGGVRVDSLHP
jgi:hypothetical protein